MSKIKDKRFQSILEHLAAEFISHESDATSLITVTSSNLSDDGKKFTIFVSIFPEDKQEISLEFLNRKIGHFKEFIKTKSKLRSIPFLTFALDAGEKNRQIIEDISNKEREE